MRAFRLRQKNEKVEQLKQVRDEVKAVLKATEEGVVSGLKAATYPILQMPESTFIVTLRIR